MGDKEQVALILLHRLLDPLPALDVQVVRRLVQNQQIDLRVHEHTQPQAGLLAAGQGGHGLEHVLPPELKGGQAVPGGLGRAVQVIDHGVHQAALRVVKVDDLGQIADLHRGAQAQLALVGALLPHKNLNEGGLARAVVPQQGDALAPGHLQIHVIKQGAAAEGLFQVLDGQHLVPPELPLPKADLHLPGLFGPVGHPHALDALFHGLGPFERLVHAGIGPGAQLLGGLLQLLDLGLLLLILALALFKAALLLHGVKAVVSGVKFRLAPLDLNDPVHHLVQEVAVVGHGEHGAFELLQILLQPLGGPQVQVVGGLVQQQDVRVLQNQAAQVHPGLLSAGELVKGPLAHLGGDGQAVAHLVLVGVHLIAAPGLECGGKLVIPGHGGLVLPPAHGLGQLGHLPLHLVQRGEGIIQHVLHRVACGIDGDLGDQAHPLARGDDHLSLVIVHHAGENAQQGRLAAAIRPQQSDPFS